MKYLDIRFIKEKDKKRLEYQLATIKKIQERLPKRIEEKFDDVQVRIRFSSSAGIDVSGFRINEEKKCFMEYLEELWNDNDLLEE